MKSKVVYTMIKSMVDIWEVHGMQSILGIKIKEFRTKRGITQEELGQMVGVTTQAVSKWERGGTPDAELLPQIAGALDVSIDALFDMGQNTGRCLEDIIIAELDSKEDKEAFQRAISLCIAIEIGLFKIDSMKSKMVGEMMESVNDEIEHEYYSTLVTNEGLIRTRLSPNGRYFFIMPEPEDGYRDFLENIDWLSRVFTVLSDRDALKLLFFMYQRTHKHVSTQLLAESVGISEEKVETIMERLAKINVAKCCEVEMIDGDTKIYSICRDFTMIPILAFARELGVEKILDFGHFYQREKPMF